MKTYKIAHTMLAALLAIILLATSTLSIVSIRAATAYHVTLTISNVSSQAIAASADDLSDPTHALFSLQNSTPLWYGIAMQTTPTGIVPSPTVANPTGDLVTTTFYGSTPLLPPIRVLPFDQTSKSTHFEALHLMAAFSGPNQQIQLDLNPFEAHAITLDVCTLLLQLLGEHSPNAQIGLLAPSFLKELFAATSTLKDFANVTNSYTQVLQSTSDKSTMLASAYAFAKAVETLFANTGEQTILADILWKMLGKAIAYPTVLKSISNFVNVQFGLGLESFIRDESTILASNLISQNDPTVVLQSVVNTAQPSTTPTITQTANTATPTPTSTSVQPISTVLPRVTPSPTATPKKTP